MKKLIFFQWIMMLISGLAIEVWAADGAKDVKKVPLKGLAPDTRLVPKNQTSESLRKPASVPEAKKVTPSTSADDGNWVPVVKFPGRRD